VQRDNEIVALHVQIHEYKGHQGLYLKQKPAVHRPVKTGGAKGAASGRCQSGGTVSTRGLKQWNTKLSSEAPQNAKDHLKSRMP